jgi:tungstate transport system substrate-binding protein
MIGRWCVWAVAAAAGLASGCSARPTPTFTLATTTSTRDSGLLDALLPLFRSRTGTEVRVLAVGTGQALELGRRGDADVLLVHDPAGEQRFMDQGFGLLWRQVMYNDFVLVGPPTDPAGVGGQGSVTEAFVRVARAEAAFVSRGDESGTHRKEQEVWRQASIQPQGGWYLRAGAGMAEVLRMAGEKRAYTLTDRGTFLALGKAPGLVVLSQGDPLLRNQYSVIVVSPDKHPHIRREAAQQFADFLVSPEARKAIADFGKDRFGESLFFPDGEETGGR